MRYITRFQSRLCDMQNQTRVVLAGALYSAVLRADTNSDLNAVAVKEHGQGQVAVDDLQDPCTRIDQCFTIHLLYRLEVKTLWRVSNLLGKLLQIA